MQNGKTRNTVETRSGEIEIITNPDHIRIGVVERNNGILISSIISKRPNRDHKKAQKKLKAQNQNFALRLEFLLCLFVDRFVCLFVASVKLFFLLLSFLGEHQVIAHRIARRFRIAIANGAVDRAMHLRRLL